MLNRSRLQKKSKVSKGSKRKITKHNSGSDNDRDVGLSDSSSESGSSSDSNNNLIERSDRERDDNGNDNHMNDIDESNIDDTGTFYDSSNKKRNPQDSNSISISTGHQNVEKRVPTQKKSYVNHNRDSDSESDNDTDLFESSRVSKKKKNSVHDKKSKDKRNRNDRDGDKDRNVSMKKNKPTRTQTVPKGGYARWTAEEDLILKEQFALFAGTRSVFDVIAMNEDLR